MLTKIELLLRKKDVTVIRKAIDGVKQRHYVMVERDNWQECHLVPKEVWENIKLKK
jgi:hypothetical protein